MTRIWMLVIALLVSLQVTSYCAERVTDSDKRLSIEMAEGWSVEANPQQGIVLMLRGPENSGANLNIIPEHNVSISLEDYEKLSETNTSRDPEMFDFTILTRESMEIGGVKAGSWVYTAKVGQDKTPIKCKVVFIINGNTAYVITCGVLENLYDQSAAAFDSMLGSVVWEKTSLPVKKAPLGKPTRISDKSKVISLLLPTDWKNDPNPPKGAVMLLTGAPATSSLSILKESVGNATLAEYEKASEQNATSGTDGFKIISKSKIKIGGTPASKWVYTAFYGEQKIPLKCMVILVIRKKVAYTMTLGAVESQFDEAKPRFETFIKSITWLK